MEKQLAANIVKDYQVASWKYRKLAHLVARYLKEEVNQMFRYATWPVVHVVQDRAKSPNSLYRNLVGDRYSKDITSFQALALKVDDLAAARAIFHFRDDLEQFAKARVNLRRWFGEESFAEFADMKIRIRDHRGRVKEVFGYSSFHFPVRVTGSTDFWHALTEDDRCDLSGMRCEVQLRTVLQHAWAEAEHDVRYKTSSRSLVEDRLWGVVSATLEGADYLISGRKAEAARSHYAAEKLVLDDGRSYSEALYAQVGEERDNVRFGYELLDDWRQGEPRFDVSAELFEVDDAIRKAGGPPGYKATLWKALRAKAQPMISAFDHDTTVARVAKWTPSIRTIGLQPAMYSDQLVTNVAAALEEEIEGRRVESFGVRLDDDQLSARKSLLPFELSAFANTIGVACVLLTADGRWALCLRAGNLIYEPQTLGCPASGSLAWAEPNRWGNRDIDWVRDGLIRECREELGFEAKPLQVRYLAFCRELKRGGKPQFFFLIDLSDVNHGVAAARLEMCWRVYADHEQEELHFLSTEQARILVGRDAGAIRTTIADVGAGQSNANDELRMNLAFALAYKNLVH